MRKVFNYFNRKNILLVSGILSVLFLILSSDDIYFFIYDLHRSFILNLFQYLRLITWIALPIFISCLFTWKQGVFNSWKKFSSIYVLVYLFFIILVPWNWGDVFLPIYKGTVALALSVFYFLISLILIIFKSIQLRNKN